MRAKTSFHCQACGHQAPRWLGRCPDCGAWNTLKEERVPVAPKGRQPQVHAVGSVATPICDIEIVGEARRKTGLGEFDRVLGGGVIPGSLVLIGGDPGIGKTTLLLQALPGLALDDEQVLYVSGEESPRQIKMRGQRLGVQHRNLLILAETSLEQILKSVQDLRPAAVVVDSIQTVYTEQLTSAPGSISQVQEVAGQLMWFAKRSSVPVFIIGHVTPEAQDGGPIALLKDGDPMTVDAQKRVIDVHIPDAEMAKRKAAWKKPEPREKRGVLAKYAKTVTSASEGATTS